MRVYIDFKSPAAYLAVAPTEALAARQGLEIEWRAFNAVVNAVPAQVPDESKGQTHRRVRALAQQKMHKLYARSQGLELRFPRQPGCSDRALWVLEQLPIPHRPAFVKACFAAYWQAGEDLNAAQVVAELLRQCAADPELAHHEVPVAAVEALNNQAREVDGVVDVPAYLAGDELFIGREHLPCIEALCQAGSAR